MAINWVAIEDALWDWVKGATAFPDDAIRFADQNTEEAAYADSALITIGDLGSDRAPPTIHQTFNPAQAGAEIGLEVQQRTEFSVTVDVFTDETTGGNRAVAFAAQVRARIAFESVRSALRAAGVVPLASGAVRNLTTLEDADREGRAQLEVTFQTTVTDTERSGYIATVEATHVETGATTIITSE